MSELYLDAGLTSTHDLGIVDLAGAALGGGTTVNWWTSLRLPARIAEEWAAASGIAGLGAELAPHYAEVERSQLDAVRVGHNANNSHHPRGRPRRSALHAAESPRNAPRNAATDAAIAGSAARTTRNTRPQRMLSARCRPRTAERSSANARVLRIETRGNRARRRYRAPTRLQPARSERLA